MFFYYTSERFLRFLWFVDKMKRKICVVVASRANYGRIKAVLKAIQKHPKLELQLVLGASALLERYGDLREIIKKFGGGGGGKKVSGDRKSLTPEILSLYLNFYSPF